MGLWLQPKSVLRNTDFFMPGGAVKSRKNSIIATVVATGLIIVLLYLPTLDCGFVNIDDPDYIINNPLIKSLDWGGVVASFTGAHVGWWMPLTWISFMIEHYFWGLNPLGYHLTNILLHAANAALVVLIADRLLRERFLLQQSQWPYYGMLLFAGLLFGIHPLRVESVAWVAERKDVLNGLFSLAALYFYIGYARKREAGKGGSGDYFCSLVLLILSLMAKSVSVVLPLLMLLLDCYPLRRVRPGRVAPLLVEKAPFLAASAAIILVTLYFTAEAGYLVSYSAFPFSQRLVVSGNALLEYVRLFFLPVAIGPLHLIPDPIPASYGYKSFVVVILAAAVFYKRNRWPLLAAACAGFVIPLLPVLAFFQNGDQAFASRFTYLPAVLPSIAVAAVCGSSVMSAAEAVQRQVRAGVVMIAALVLILYAVGTVRLIGIWHDGGTLLSRAVSLEPSAILYKERGLYYHTVGDYERAAADYTMAINSAAGGFREYIYNLYAFRGESLRAAGLHAEALQDFSRAIGMSPRPLYFRLRGETLQAMGRMREADDDFRIAGPGPAALEWYWIPVHE